MPLSTSAYFSAFIAYCLWSHANDFKHKKDPLWFAVAEAISSVFLVITALSYWLSSLHALSTSILLVMFCSGCAITLGQMVVVCRRNIADPELSSQGKWFVALSGSILGIIIHAPLLLWGFKSAVLGSYVGT